jgi:hypothetical protein
MSTTSMNTRRHPRTMVQAFGPYTDHRLHPMPDPRGTPRERALGVLLAVFIGIVGALLLVHYLAR